MPLQPFRLPGPSTLPLSNHPLSPFHDTHSPIRLSPLRASSFSDSFNFKLSIEAPGPVRTVNLFSCGCPLTRIDAKVTRVKLKSFICHSYKKHPGVGVRLYVHFPLCTFNPAPPFLQMSSLVPINVIPRQLSALCFHTLTHSFAPSKTLSPIFSFSCALLGENTRGGGTCTVSSIPSFVRQRWPWAAPSTSPHSSPLPRRRFSCWRIYAREYPFQSLAVSRSAVHPLLTQPLLHLFQRPALSTSPADPPALVC